jgi:hypothetical protein
VRSGQKEAGEVVIESRRAPAGCRVTGIAIGAEAAAVGVVARVACAATGGSAAQYAVGVTTLTGNVHMFACELEG